MKYIYSKKIDERAQRLKTSFNLFLKNRNLNMKQNGISVLSKRLIFDLLVPFIACIACILVIHPKIIWAMKDSLLFYGPLLNLGDGAGAIFHFDHVVQALFGTESLFHTSRFFFPDGGYLETYVVIQNLALLFFPLIRLWGIPFGANVLILILMACNGLGMYFLGRVLIRNREISLAGALMYTIMPPLIGEFFILQRPVTAFYGPALAGVGLLCLYLDRKLSWWSGLLTGCLLALTALLYPFNLVYLSIWVLSIFVISFYKSDTVKNKVLILGKMALVVTVVLIITGPYIVWVIRTNPQFIGYQSHYISKADRVLHFPLNAIFSGINATRSISTYWLCIPLPLTLGAFFSVVALRRKIVSLLPHIIGGVWALWIALGPRIDLVGVGQWSGASYRLCPAWYWMPHVFMSTRFMAFGSMNAQRAIFIFLAVIILLVMKGMVWAYGKQRNGVIKLEQRKGWILRLSIPISFVILFAWWGKPRYAENFIPWPDFTSLRVASADQVVLDLPINIKYDTFFLSFMHRSPSLGGPLCVRQMDGGKNSNLWRKNAFLRSLKLISKEKDPLLVQQRDLEELNKIGLRHIFFWKMYCQRKVYARKNRGHNQTYQFLLQTLGKPVAVSTEVVVFRIPQRQRN
ncbi:MAG: hypothetical protein A2Z72_04670 [Omnitrophica bacterium RBG_13_46_9]|nr:MAG: hypothetical protein A2Z72_04670 [Omnitrophica bacterium RBG_13_46_9]